MLGTPLLLSAAVLIGAPPKDDLRATINAQYQAFNSALSRKDQPSLNKWVEQTCTDDFVYTSRDKHSFKKKAFLAGIAEQNQATKKVLLSKVRIDAPVVHHSRLTVTTYSDFKGIVTFDTRDLTLIDSSVTTDTWVLKGGVWKMKSSVQTQDKTQMHENE